MKSSNIHSAIRKLKNPAELVCLSRLCLSKPSSLRQSHRVQLPAGPLLIRSVGLDWQSDLPAASCHGASPLIRPDRRFTPDMKDGGRRRSSLQLECKKTPVCGALCCVDAAALIQSFKLLACFLFIPHLHAKQANISPFPLI